MSYLSVPAAPGRWFLLLGVIMPILVVLIELATGLCADAFFDPLPTFPHVIVVLCVPAINFALWRAARETADEEDGAAVSPWIAVAGGAGIAIAATYVLLFLPLLPIAFIGIIVFGIGLLPFAPLFSLVVATKLMARLGQHWANAWQLGLSGVGIGLLALIAVDVPATATHLALGWSAKEGAAERRGVRLMRALGDRQMLLRMCYGDDGRATGLVSAFASMWQDGLFTGRGGADSTRARQLYFRATGQAFNAAPLPSGLRRGGRGTLFDFDEDQGGTVVGGRARGLSLAESRIDGSISAADNVGYIEWTAEFSNASAQQREARMTLALPPGAVASRATLWVDGEPREASVAARSAARAAYERVVQTRRDPLLVTTDGADRLLVQAFPVQPNAKLKLRIGISAPLAIARDGSRSLTLPAIVDRNFEVADDFTHSLWMEADEAIASRGTARNPTKLANGATRLQGQIADVVLTASPPRIAIGGTAQPSVRSANVPAADGQPRLAVVQTIARIAAPAPRALTILLDGSAGNRSGGKGLTHALDAIPAGTRVGIVIAADTPVSVAPAPWSAAQRARVRDAIADARFEGGQDNALALALDMAGDHASDLLWVHAAQPVDFTRPGARIGQYLDRSEAMPRLIRYQSTPGPAFRIEHRWFDTARTIPSTGDPATDLGAIIADLTDTAPRWTVVRTEAPAAEGSGSPHIVRLWGADRLSDVPVKGPSRDAAIALAHRLNVVTPVSGAVVLETDADYDASGLDVPDAADVPTVPEPETWALMIVLAGLFAWILRRRGFGFRIGRELRFA